MKRILIAGFALLCAFVAQVSAVQAGAPAAPPRQPNGLALTPPMGWNSWNKFGCNINETVIRHMADAMAESGMKEAGYEYVVIDDCWQTGRDQGGNIIVDAARFPTGMKALGDYIHAKGLKFGIYSDAGRLTCGKRPGGYGHEYQDARQYAEWGVDYLKYDWCSTYTQDAKSSYETMSDALRASGRPIVFSLCEWGLSKPWLWATNVGNLWRTTDDIYDHWQGVHDYEHGVLDILDLQVGLENFSGPGHWNDPDMLEVGNGKMTFEEYKSHFSLWALLAAPLIAGNDLSDMTADTRSILTNRDVIAVDQDALGVQGRRVQKDGDLEVWARPLKGGGRAVILLNRGAAPSKISFPWEVLGYPSALKLKVRDLWSHHDLPAASGMFSAEVAPHGVVMIRLAATSDQIQTDR